MPARFDSTAYRYPNENLILALTVLLVVLVIVITATATVCLSVVFVIGAVAIGYTASRSQHQALILKAQRLNAQNAPALEPLLQTNAARLQVEPVDIFVVPSRGLNAYTFGMDSPKAIVLYSSLFKIMDKEELQFIIGHEMGHVRLGHTWLNTLVGGLAGIPSSYGAAALLELAFRSWNRACEFSADRAGVLACANPRKAISALIKLEAGPGLRDQASLVLAIQHIEAEDDNILSNLNELLSTHPMVIKRLEQIKAFTASPQYQRLQAAMDANLGVPA